MCCGNTRQNMSGTTIRNRSTQGSGIRPQANSTPHSMAPRPRPGNAMRTPRFEYKGPTGINVFSPVTGRGYRFDHPGARLEADPRDRALLTAVPGLRQVL